MRRKDREIIKREEILKILRESKVCRLAINNEPFPYIVPMNYGIEEQGEDIVLYFHSAKEGTKIDLIGQDNNVSFEVDNNFGVDFDEDKRSCSMLYNSVIGNGIIEIVDDDKKEKALRLILKHYGNKDDFYMKESLIKNTVCFKLEIKNISGKKRYCSG